MPYGTILKVVTKRLTYILVLKQYVLKKTANKWIIKCLGFLSPAACDFQPCRPFHNFRTSEPFVPELVHENSQISRILRLYTIAKKTGRGPSLANSYFFLAKKKKEKKTANKPDHIFVIPFCKSNKNDRNDFFLLVLVVSRRFLTETRALSQRIFQVKFFVGRRAKCQPSAYRPTSIDLMSRRNQELSWSRGSHEE